MDNVTLGDGGSVRVLDISDVINQLAVVMADASVKLAHSIHEEAGRLSSGMVALMPESEVNAVRGRLMDRLGTLRAISDMFDLMGDGERRSLLDRMAVSQALYVGHDGLIDSAYELLARHIVSSPAEAEPEADKARALMDGVSVGRGQLWLLGRQPDGDQVQAEAGSAGGAGGSGVADAVAVGLPDDDDDDTVTDGLALPIWSPSMMVNGLTYGL